MVKRWARRALAGATAAGMFVARHRIVGGVGVFLILIAVAAGTYSFNTLGLQSGLNSGSNPDGGTSAPGSHQWLSLTGDIEATFCDVCHVTIHDELVAGPHKSAGMSTCSYCHAPSASGHVADSAQCADCHQGRGETDELVNDAHASFLGDLGENPDGSDASWSCKACHTAVEIEIAVTQNPALPLELGPTYP